MAVVGTAYTATSGLESADNEAVHSPAVTRGPTLLTSRSCLCDGEESDPKQMSKRTTDVIDGSAEAKEFEMKDPEHSIDENAQLEQQNVGEDVSEARGTDNVSEHNVPPTTQFKLMEHSLEEEEDAPCAGDVQVGFDVGSPASYRPACDSDSDEAEERKPSAGARLAAQDKARRDEAFWTAAQLALHERERRERVTAFLKSHSFKRVNSKQGWWSFTYPLHVAAQLGDARLVQLLLDSGARRRRRDSSGQTARRCVKQLHQNGSHDAVIRVLKFSQLRRKLNTPMSLLEMPTEATAVPEAIAVPLPVTALEQPAVDTETIAVPEATTVPAPVTTLEQTTAETAAMEAAAVTVLVTALEQPVVDAGAFA